MIYEFLILRFGEISLKGKNKKKFIVKLETTIRKSLKKFPNLFVKRHYDDIEITLHGEDVDAVAQQLQSIFGIHSIRAAIKVENNLDDIKQGVLQIAQSEVYAQTFKISARRKNKNFEYPSNVLNQELGGHILKNMEALKVDVHHPDLNIRVEVGEHDTRLYGREYPGAGGLPVGTSGKVMLMLSGGIDSPVAGYLLQKRGADIEAIHFHSPPYTNDRAKQKVVDLAEKLQRFGGHIKLHIVPFTNAQVAIKDSMPDNYRMTIMRRMMLRIAEKLAKKNGALAIATGESLGQVASQTLESMHTINEVTNYPVLRPLVSMDKIDIMAIAQKIDTYDISIRPYEDCCTIFLPTAPKTKPKREHANKFEQYLPIDELINEALEGVQTIDLLTKSQESDDLDDLL
ncbi:tRNA 4-thiouridine(8) synthase ThiI [Terrilactibacillus sp. BCM23-1]|uniref:Probable tRNA sulfurtransferase n=1 Tax=Terrilactibacillus tamarindi TaxID=2599694 RepID=A0A6N8CU22_9BACI|nr:tRNA uracil 4-sulfurtransferase ThiI [Terrilactibacillus tamarindi]MTT32515.1 tRNA 4-thiouridine(8) synthase ThiI [Terrilactibacillus tamarindi]